MTRSSRIFQAARSQKLLSSLWTLLLQIKADTFSCDVEFHFGFYNFNKNEIYFLFFHYPPHHPVANVHGRVKFPTMRFHSLREMVQRIWCYFQQRERNSSAKAETRNTWNASNCRNCKRKREPGNTCALGIQIDKDTSCFATNKILFYLLLLSARWWWLVGWP